MENTHRQSHGGNHDVLLDQPIYSRLFVICDKNIKESNLREAFSKFGVIEDLKIPNDKQGMPKGICYIKFSKTSEAAYALEGLHMKSVPGSQRALKVYVANNRSEVDTKDYDNEKYRRLFINIPKSMKEKELEEIFSPYGNVLSILIQRDRNTEEPKGLAYIVYSKFSEAANAYESCDKQYRAIFAQPKAQKPNTSSKMDFIGQPAWNEASLTAMMGKRFTGFTRVNFMCSLRLPRMHVERLFDLIPGLVHFEVYPDYNHDCARGTASYSNPNSAAFALSKLHEFEYPLGSSIFVRPDKSSFTNTRYGLQESNDIPKVVSNLRNAILSSTASSTPDVAQLAEAVVEANKLIQLATGITPKDNLDSNNINYCSVKLPSTQPLADIDSTVAKRCFLVCKPAPPPLTVLRDIFCRFGNLINVYTLPNKTVGYARYASEEAANEAIKTLHGAEICGVRIKVLEAEDEAPPRKRRHGEGSNVTD